MPWPPARGPPRPALQQWCTMLFDAILHVQIVLRFFGCLANVFFVALCLCRLPAARPRPALQQWRAFFLMPSYHQRQRQQHQQHRQRPQHPQYLVVCVLVITRVVVVRIYIIPQTPQHAGRPWAITTVDPARSHHSIYLGNNDLHYVWLRRTDA